MRRQPSLHQCRQAASAEPAGSVGPLPPPQQPGLCFSMVARLAELNARGWLLPGSACSCLFLPVMGRQLPPPPPLRCSDKSYTSYSRLVWGRRKGNGRHRGFSSPRGLRAPAGAAPPCPRCCC